MKNKERILAALTTIEHCDDCLSVTSGVYPRQTVYTICSSLSQTHVIMRLRGQCNNCQKNKIVNRLLTENVRDIETAPTTQSESFPPSNTGSWYWEGNVQSQLVSYFVEHDFIIRSVADTASRESGKDIIAIAPDGIELWVSVKGYPEKSPHVQARHWFSQAIFDLILYRGENPNVRLAIALPDGFTTYRNLSPRVNWLKQTTPFEIFWISEDGSVRIE